MRSIWLKATRALARVRMFSESRRALTGNAPYLIAIVGVVLAFLFLAIITGKPPVVVTIKHVKGAQLASGTLEVFEIRNFTRTFIFVKPVAVECRNGPSWKPCFDIKEFRLSQEGPRLAPSDRLKCEFLATNLPAGFPLRLRITVVTELTGAVGLCQRIKLGILEGRSPFETPNQVYSKATEIVSDEFLVGLPTAGFMTHDDPDQLRNPALSWFGCAKN